MRNLEHQHAVALMRWWAYFANAKKYDQRLLFAIPNGGMRNIVVAMKLKAEGVRAGVPDFFLAIPKNGSGGLFIELKHEKGRASESQEEMIELLGHNGYRTTLAKGWDAARVAIEDYLK